MWGTAEEKKAFAALYPFFYGSQEVRDAGKGIRTIKKLAEQGYVPGICELGIAYFDHQGVRRDYGESFRQYLHAAEAGYPSAEGAVGNFYAIVKPRHEACEHDPVKAAAWWLRASEHGNAGAQCNLAGAYLQGSGVEKEPSAAYLWASLAVHCSTIRFRSAEVYRDQAAALLDPETLALVRLKLEALKKTLPLPWSEHRSYWKGLYQTYVLEGQAF